jgi:hypothetical protein
MHIRTFALVSGVGFLASGIAPFIPGLLGPYEAGEQGLMLEHGAGEFLGLFPTNTLHNVVHLLFGAWGLGVHRNALAATRYAQGVALVFGAFVIMGLVPGLNTLFGLAPLHGNDVWAHALLVVVAAYFGFVRRSASQEYARP